MKKSTFNVRKDAFGAWIRVSGENYWFAEKKKALYWIFVELRRNQLDYVKICWKVLVQCIQLKLSRQALNIKTWEIKRAIFTDF